MDRREDNLKKSLPASPDPAAADRSLSDLVASERLTDCPYGAEELSQIQSTIVGAEPLTELEIDKIRSSFIATDFPPHLANFIALSIRNPDLFAALSRDEKVRTFGPFCFFPKMLPLVFGAAPCPTLRGVFSGMRGTTVAFDHPDGAFVIKPLQSRCEQEIAELVGQLKVDDMPVGPSQLPTLPGFLTEEFVDAPNFLRAPAETFTNEKLLALGSAFGELLNTLHRSDILYNDTILADDFGKSHLLVLPGGKLKLIDFGRAFSLSNYPKFSEDQVMSFLATQPMGEFLLTSDSREKALRDTRRHLESLTKGQILDRDVDFAAEGMYFAAMRLNCSLSSFEQGFHETYEHCYP